MKHEAAIAQLEIHASNCENNAVIQEREGQYEDAANNRISASDYRRAIETLAADTTEKLTSMWKVKTSATADGKYIAAGIGLRIDEPGVDVQSQILVVADKFTINGKPS